MDLFGRRLLVLALDIILSLVNKDRIKAYRVWSITVIRVLRLKGCLFDLTFNLSDQSYARDNRLNPFDSSH
jgi:hypothetical protein